MNHGSYIAAFITGHSVRGCTGLSKVQVEFQRRSAIPEGRWLAHNFPYHPTAPFPKSVPLLAASLSNIGHYFASRKPQFKERHREAVSAVFSPYERVILLAGSCGLELLNNLDLAPELRQKLHIFACGPVSRSLPHVASCFMVQGEHDWISRAFHRSVDQRYPCSHMGYLASPTTLTFFNEFTQRVLCEAPVTA